MNPAKHATRRDAVASFAACSLLLFAAGCGKSPSPGRTTNQESPDRLSWNLKTLVEPYEKAGFANRVWDEPARRALVAFARLRGGVAESNEPCWQIIATNCEAAIGAGCKDPMIAYLRVRTLNATNRAETFVMAFLKAAQDLDQSSYPSIRKFYAWQRFANQLTHTYHHPTNYPPEIQRAFPRNPVGARLMEALADKTMPATEAYEACAEALPPWRGDQGNYQAAYQAVERPLFENWPNASTTWLLKGEAYIQLAWLARGGGYANTVTKEGWKEFSKHLQTAEQALDHAWKLDARNPQIALKMIELELGQGQGRDRMELWFHKAMALDPDDYEACNMKLEYLEPKWYGSREEMLAFGWECVESKTWGGKVPLILLNAHTEIPKWYLEGEEKTNYWKQPEVWPDIQQAFEKFFQLNPQATGWYHDYAWHAWQCGQWHALNELIPKLGRVNYPYFGGKAAFDEMARLAQERAREPEPPANTLAIETHRLSTRIAAKLQQGKNKESEFADEIKAGDALLDRHKDKNAEEMSQILFAKAQLYSEVFGDFDKGKQGIAQLKMDYPDTELGRDADRILAGMEKKAEAKKTRQKLVPGKAFPGFDEKDLTGKPLSLANYRGKVVLIDFWATWCGPCVAELPNVLKAYEKHHANGFDIIGISLDEEQERLERFIQQKSIPWPQYYDGKGWNNKLAAQYGVDAIPATFLLDREGLIIGTDLDGENLEQAVAKALAGK